jgi:acyl-CoA thioester hydrolase
MAAPFRHTIRVRWGECDPQGIVFNPNYLAYYDLVVGELWRQEIGPWDEFEATTGVTVVAAEAGIRFRSAARHEEELVLELSVTNVGTTSFATALRVVREDGSTACDAWMRYVCVEPPAMTKTPVPDAVRAVLESHAVAAEDVEPAWSSTPPSAP